ncbi:MAG: hypothetical protein JXA21_05190 [Anaerolineae bacterium]|nr:hypothetical protein [Anaerolineae bacterium]
MSRKHNGYGTKINRNHCAPQIFTWFLVGLFLSRYVHLGAIAKKIPGRAKRNSTERRLRRLMDNAATHTRVWYRPVAEHLIEAMHAHGLPIRLLVDGNKVGFGHQLLMVAVAYRRRAIPIAWTWIPGARGHSDGWKQLALLAYVRQLLPAKAQVPIAGDCEFGPVAVLQQLAAWKWEYVMQQSGSYPVKSRNNVWIVSSNTAAKGFGSRRYA